MTFRFQSHTRHDIYRLWRDAATLRKRFDETVPGLFRVDVDYEPERLRRFWDALVKLTETENVDGIDGGSWRVAISDVVVLRNSGAGITMATLESAARAVERVLGRVAISQARVKAYVFVEDPTSLETEYDLLSTALDIDEELVGNETLFVDELAEAAHTSEADVRRILCRWMDDAIAYVHEDAFDDDREPFVLENGARTRLGRWDRYERKRMEHTTFLIRVGRPYPIDAEKLVRGVGRELRLRFEEVTEGNNGIMVDWYWPSEMSAAERAAIGPALTAAVTETFVEALRREASPPTVSITNNTTYHNAGQVAAQGPGATAVGNTLVQQQIVDSDTEQLADELRRLREHLVARGINSGEDAIEVGTVAEAEKAATKKDPGAVATALKKLAAGTLELVGTLGLLRLKMWCSEKLGIDTPSLLPPGSE